MRDFEKLGVFYLGRQYDVATRQRRDDPILYDSRDLVTHGVCVGMTGSGKTGLCLALIEEAAIDAVPVIAVDPKGDLGNLLLTFPSLSPADFRPWISEDDARRRGVTPDDYAAQQAALWRKGLAEWGQDGARIQRMRDAVDLAIYTPGSTAGIPVSIMRSLAAPPAAVRGDAELMGDRVGTTATSLLALMGVDADPVRSREHILLATIIGAAWGSGIDLDLAALIQQIQAPPVKRIGVLDVEAFYPAADRFELAMRLNNLLAAPGFGVWTEGEPLDAGRLLYTAEGKPRVSIVSIAHLDDKERMFFLSLLLGEVLSWMRGQPGTTSLRALFYMDEIFGFFPPVANPPAKKPLLSLLKQGRAFGLGVLLATQNPVDLDYKGLANAGTWLLGRLQTERDKARVLDGLEGAVAGAGGRFDRQSMDQTLSALGARVFLMNNVHESAPVVFESRWALSYLRGPMTREDIRRVMAGRRAEALAPPPTERPGEQPAMEVPAAPPARAVRRTRATAGSSAPAVPAGTRPVLPPDVPQYFLPMRQTRPAGAPPIYEPRVYAAATVRFADPKFGLNESRDVALVAELPERLQTVAWDQAIASDLAAADLAGEPVEGASFGDLPPAASKPKSYVTWSRDLLRWLSLSQQIELLRSPKTGELSRASESERDFRIRLQTTIRGRRDQAVAELRQQYAVRLAQLDERIRRAQEAVAREQAQVKSQTVQTAVSVGATILGAFLGRKTVSVATLGRATTTARGVGRTMKEAGDVRRATESVGELQRQRSELESQLQADIAALAVTFDPATEELEKVAVRPKRGDVTANLVALVWEPRWGGQV